MTEFAAPRPVTLDGREYRFSPLTLVDIEELDNWVRKEYMTRVLKAIPDCATAEDKAQAMRIAQDKAVNLSWLSGQGAVFIASHRGMLKVAQLALCKNHADLTDERLQQIIVADPKAMTEISEAMKGPKSAFQNRQAKEVKKTLKAKTSKPRSKASQKR